MLRRLDLRGFKSFASPISLDFGPGVNVIVGPNGSGKSNLAEAIVWSMGEQRANKLRAAGMTEMVFSGGDGRPAAGVAEVRMTVSPAIDDPGLPTEIEVARRVTRTGEATYQLNGTSCRLLDVHESLGTFGLGPDALAVIRQGQVEAVCTARPADLRAVVEEAAGVALSRRRRRRAEAKLARVAERLERARDLANELLRRQATLERQAKAATRAAELEREINAAREQLALTLAASAIRDQRSAEATVAHHTGAASAAQEALAQAQAAVATNEAELAQHVTAREAARELVRGAQSDLERLRGRVELVRERCEDAHRQIARDAYSRAAAVDARDDAHARAAEARQRFVDADGATREVNAARDAANQQLAAREIEYRTARSAADDAQATADDAARALTSLEARIAQLRDARERASARILRLDADPTDGANIRAERRAEISAERAVRWFARAQEADAASNDAQAAVTGAEQGRRDLAALVMALRPSSSANDDALGSGLEVTPGTERAFGAALGALADAPVLTSTEDADRILDGGAAAVLVPVAARAAAQPPRVGRPLIDMVLACDSTRRVSLERVLSGVWLVDDLAEVPGDASGLFVTASGDALRPAQGVRLRPVSDWAIAAEHRAATLRLEKADAELAQLQVARDRAAATATGVRGRHRAADRAAAKALQAVGIARANAAHASAARAEALATRDAAAGDLDDALEGRGALEGVRNDALDAAARAAIHVAGLQGQREELRTRCQAQDEHASVANAAVAAARLALAEADEQVALIELRAQAPVLQIDLDVMQESISALDRVVDALGRRVDDYVRAGAADEHAIREIEHRVAAARAIRDQASGVAATASEAIHVAQIALASATARATELVGSYDFSDDEINGELPDPDAAVRDIEDMERRRRMIGAVNELAGPEWEETTSRADEIAEQVDDLEAAAAELTAHMQGLDDAVTDGFQQIFTVVQERFTDAIEVLFPGGAGRLVAVEPEDEDGEMGIEISVVPAGKRARPLAMMSGGERSLIALAFCLAIAMTRPAPFYLLDEVEAALDDTNLRRFLTLVRRLSKETQFVMITHQQPTVEIADTLFGVTMGSDGASQIVSRRLGDSIEGVARTTVRRQLKAIQGGRA